ncbi:PadR family transcriptional regulator [Hymenobacter metallilatus]|uniref:PadR family transcriptional regulator n=1 Tax=Hymenobacter metallilatus TaxID=2493666 RepID=A0A428JLX3_9BACT|nr:PadR family transcriptional regulator [Hymenobacter metallilatus]RSK33995.1 PadR family transcriptional regulator [Hymenobacter metallilatus]
MKVENTQVQMRKGILEFCILEIIARGEVYASDMLEELTSARMIVVEGTLYPLLTRLKNAGLLDYTWKESTSGPPRKYYTLTADGQEFLHQLRLTWEEVQDSIRIIRQKPRNPDAVSPAGLEVAPPDAPSAPDPLL